MSFNKFFAQTIRFDRQIGGSIFKRFISNRNIHINHINNTNNNCANSGFLKFTKRTNIGNINKGKKKIITSTSMMGLVTISDSIKDALYKSEVIPTVIHDEKFTPKGFLMVHYNNSDKEVTMGNTLKVEDTQEKPIVHFTLNLPDTTNTEDKTSSTITKDDKFTLIVTDPDAPTKDDDKWSEYCHYVCKDIKLNQFSGDDATVEDSKFADLLTTQDLSGIDLIPYMGPGPPPKTGLHRYVFLLYKQNPNKDPEAPNDRPCWGTGIPGSGAAEYAEKYGLELYAVNFFYCKNKEQ